MKDIKVLNLFIVMILASLLTGCSRSRQFQKIREEYPYKLRVVVGEFKADSKQIFLDDVANLSDYYRDKLEDTGLFSVVRDSTIINDFSSPNVAKNTTLLRSLSKRNLIEGLITGTIKKYYYKKDRRSFSIALALDISVFDTYTGEEIFKTSKNYAKKFRLKRKNQKDYSALNQQLLDMVLGQINKEMIIEISKVIEERRKENGGQFVTVMNGSKEQNLLLWPKSAIESNINKITQRNSLTKPSIQPSSSFQLTNKEKQKIEQIDLSPKQETLEKPISYKKQERYQPNSSKNFHLKIQGFQLIYPLEWDKDKKYSKFYYLVNSDKNKNKDIVDIDASMEDNLVLEVFSTVDNLAVRRFLEDYFQGIRPNPIGQILELYERSYMGKLQMGFVLKDKAIIASIHRKHRDTLLNGLTGLYIKNGGISVEKVINESIKRRFASKKHSKVKKEFIVKKVAKKIPKKVMKFTKVHKAPKKIIKKMPKTISLIKRPKVKKARIFKKPTIVTAKKSSKMIPANAVFFYDMAKRRFGAHDYESAYRYFKLALDKGYDLPEVHDYLFKIEKIQSGEVNTNAFVSGAQELSTEGFITNLEYEDSAQNPSRKSSKIEYERPITNVRSFAIQKSIKNSIPVERNYQQEAFQSISSDIDLMQTNKTSKEKKPLPVIKKKSKMDKFFLEMEDMEKELQALLNKKKSLLTINKSSHVNGFWGYFFQLFAVFSLSLGIFSFLLTKNIK
ncbi:MAG: hypothetical protein COB02_00425 [Candidatus Cloacimonadota bacterium]|nr:MAG: hypothetical protein COB02_00425 [Candidatus Cloacimonadota bacterium]